MAAVVIVTSVLASVAVHEVELVPVHVLLEYEVDEAEGIFEKFSLP